MDFISRKASYWVVDYVCFESNIGLNAIAQWTFTTFNAQGLGTGGLYTNNFECPLVVSEGQLW
jgi:hypothetical protein